MNKPTKHIYDPTFQYVPAGSTDIKATFARLKAEAQKTQPQRMRKVK